MACDCDSENYTVKHVEYFSVTGATYARFQLGDPITEEDRIVDID